MYVNVNYVDTPINARDEQFALLAKKYSGKQAGAGCDFSSRDISFIFKSAIKAGKFIDHVKKFKCVSSIHAYYERN